MTPAAFKGCRQVSHHRMSKEGENQETVSSPRDCVGRHVRYQRRHRHNPWHRYFYYPHFTDEETEVQSS